MSSASNSQVATRRRRARAHEVRDQILHAFSNKAKAVGIRAVMMGELATELRVSASTLYKHFPSKEALVLASVDRWAHELAASEATVASVGRKRDGYEQFLHWVEAWSDANAALSPAFTRDLQSDYPTAFRRFRNIVNQRKELGAKMLRPLLKTDVDERVAFAVLNLILTTVVRPEFADRLRISRHEALRSAVTIWAAGAVSRKGRLHALDRKNLPARKSR